MDTDDILSLIADLDSEYCMDTPSTFHTRKAYAIKSQIQNTDNPKYMEALSGENTDEYFKANG